MANKKYIEPADLNAGGAVVLEVIYDGGISNHADGEYNYSIAKVMYDDEERYAIRWNGDVEKTWGFPSTGNTSTWFILPKELNINFFKESLGLR